MYINKSCPFLSLEVPPFEISSFKCTSWQQWCQNWRKVAFTNVPLAQLFIPRRRSTGAAPIGLGSKLWVVCKVYKSIFYYWTRIGGAGATQTKAVYFINQLPLKNCTMSIFTSMKFIKQGEHPHPGESLVVNQHSWNVGALFAQVLSLSYMHLPDSLVHYQCFTSTFKWTVSLLT